MGAKGISEVKEGAVLISLKSGPSVYKFFYVSKCNDCEHNVNLCSIDKVSEKQLDELQKRMLCSPCLNKMLKAKK